MLLTRARYLKRLIEVLERDIADPRYEVIGYLDYEYVDTGRKKPSADDGDFKINLRVIAPNEDFIELMGTPHGYEFLTINGSLNVHDRIQEWVMKDVRLFTQDEKNQVLSFNNMDAVVGEDGETKNQLLDKALMVIACGGTTRDAAALIKKPQSTLILWLTTLRREDYAQAREIRAIMRAENVEEYKQKLIDGEIKADKFTALVHYTKWIASVENKWMYQDTDVRDNAITLHDLLSTIGKSKQPEQ